MSETRRRTLSPAYARRIDGCAAAPALAGTRSYRLLSQLLIASALFACLCALAVAALPIVTAASSAEKRLEHEIKAAFLYQFGSYIDWPEGTFSHDEEPLVIGVLDGEDVATPLSGIVRHRMVKGRPVAMRRLEPGEDLTGVHILFIGAGVRPGLVDAALDRVRGQPVLTVADSDHADKSIISFVIEHDRVRFDIFLDAANESGIRISSRLLGVARRVLEGAS